MRTTLGSLCLPGFAASALVLAGTALAPSAAAQETERLPSLTPQEFVIRGTVQIDLPQIERQPLTGFGPPPRTFVVPASRTSTEIAFAPDIDALPDLGQDMPLDPPMDLPTPRRLRAEAGGGLEASRSGRLDIDVSGASGQFYVDADYDGLGGGDIDVERVDMDRIDVRGGGRTFGTARLSLDARFAVDTYTLPGSIGAAVGQSRRERRHAGISGGLEGVGQTPYALRVGYAANALGPTDDQFGTSASEGRFDASARVAPARLRLDATGGVSGDGAVGSSLRYGTVGGALQLGGDGARLLIGARGLTYGNADANTSSTTVGPIIDLSLPLGESATVFAENDPRLAVRSLFDLSGENAYVADAPRLAPDVFVADARAGLALAFGAARVRLYGLGQYTPTRLALGRGGDGLFVPSYVKATVFGGGADLALVTPGGVSATAGLEVRESDADGGELPYLAALTGTAGLAVPFAQNRGRIGLSVHAEGGRPASVGGTEDADSFALVALDARYDVAGPFAVTLRGERLIGTVERWSGFPEPGAVVMLGLRFAR